MEGAPRNRLAASRSRLASARASSADAHDRAEQVERRAAEFYLRLGDAERASQAAGARLIRLHAQTTARSLYERGGFVVRGDEFMDEGIPHVTMEKPLA